MTTEKNTNVVICPVYPGLTEAEALKLRFGDAGAPPDMQLIFVVNAIPPDGVKYDWAEAPRDSPAFRAVWEQLDGARLKNASLESEVAGP